MASHYGLIDHYSHSGLLKLIDNLVAVNNCENDSFLSRDAHLGNGVGSLLIILPIRYYHSYDYIRLGLQPFKRCKANINLSYLNSDPAI